MKTTLLPLMALLFSAPQTYAIEGPAEARFRDIYKELVETNTTLSAGSCTLAAEKMAARLKTAGLPESDLHLFSAPDHPKEGGLVAVFPGRDTKLKAILLLAHLDTVEAKREDWTRDPFTLIEPSLIAVFSPAWARKRFAASSRKSWPTPP
jgi:acetylornithine deacetylase/succinyl-diaminopimelate desuccinylase-like protein